MRPLFITGIGTGIGKTLIAAILTEKLRADYWKPVQAGYADGTDSEWVRSMITNPNTIIHPETYRLKLAASPHLAAAAESTPVIIKKIVDDYHRIQATGRPLIIEGAGGLMVPLSENDFVIDMISALEADVVLVSRNYLGSINHSLLTASICQQYGLPVAGWIFNDQYLDYAADIVRWSGIASLGSIPAVTELNPALIRALGQNISL